jgi:hypothetical protein
MAHIIAKSPQGARGVKNHEIFIQQTLTNTTKNRQEDIKLEYME